MIVRSGRPSRAMTLIGPRAWTAAIVPSSACVGECQPPPAVSWTLCEPSGFADQTLPWSMYTIESAAAVAGAASAPASSAAVRRVSAISRLERPRAVCSAVRRSEGVSVAAPASAARLGLPPATTSSSAARVASAVRLLQAARSRASVRCLRASVRCPATRSASPCSNAASARAARARTSSAVASPAAALYVRCASTPRPCRRLLPQAPQQRRLARPRGALDHDGPAAPEPRLVDHPAQRPQLALAFQQLLHEPHTVIRGRA